jgi:hypothetical protein
MSDEQIPPQKKPLKPGKGYGIIALLCAWEPGIFAAYSFCLPSISCCESHASPWGEIQIVLWLLILPSILASAVFAEWGMKTEGWRYAIAGTLLSLFWCLYFFVVFFFVLYLRFS